MLRNLRSAAQVLGVTVEVFEVHNSDEIEGALAQLQHAHPDAVLVAPDLLLLVKRVEITTALANSKLPAVYPFREYASVGGLVIHGANLGVLFERAAGYVDKILKGAKPSDLPVQLATEFELIINLKTGGQMGLHIPPTLIARFWSDAVLLHLLTSVPGTTRRRSCAELSLLAETKRTRSRHRSLVG
jgi:putative ABC transport system substrate-binding protein